MGTSGVFGFYYQGKYYVIYNHWDSYPEGLGEDVVNEVTQVLLRQNLETWKTKVSQLKVVNEQIPPTADDIQRLSTFTNLEVSQRSTDDWYCLLRNCQGSLEEVLKSGYCLNHCDDNNLSDFGEYGYIVNLDNNTLDFYHYCSNDSPVVHCPVSFTFHQLPKDDASWCTCFQCED